MTERQRCPPKGSKQTAKLGLLSQLVRKSQDLRQDDLGMMSGNSHVFVGQFENGKETVETGRVLKIMDELGIRLYAEAPPGLDESELQAKLDTLLTPMADKET